MFAKLKNGLPEFLQLPVTVGGRKLYTNDPGVLSTIGFKRYREEDRRTGMDGAYAVRYEETEREIVRIIYSLGGEQSV